MVIARKPHVAFLLLGLASLAHANDRRAEERLRELFSSPDVSGVFIQNYREFNSSNVRKILIQTDVKQRSLWTTLEPLTQQGQKTLDDGTHLHFFIPDQKVRWSIAQSVAPPLKVDRRMRLILANYEVKMLRSEKYLGRVCDRILATPKRKEMPKRVFWMDAKVPFLMRSEIHSGKTKTNLVETVSFKPNPLPDVELPDTQGWREIKQWGPKPLGESNDRQARDRIRKIIGVWPVFPRELPLGFEIINSNLNGNSASAAYLVTRLSDGFANAAVVQTSLSFQKLNIPESRNGNQSRFYVIGDAPQEVKQNLLDAYIQAESRRGN